MNDDWTREFFRGLTLELWRRAIPPEVTEDEVDFLAEELGSEDLAAGTRLLDVPCGNGRLGLHLARRGFLVTGMDAAEPFIGEARAAAQEEQLAADFHLGDMRALDSLPNIDWEAKFEGAFCMGNSFAYFDRAGTEAFLAGVARTLRPGAGFVLSTGMAAESVLPDLDDRAWEPVGDWQLLVERHYDVATGRLDAEYTIITPETRELRHATYWVFTVAEITAMLAKVGLVVEGLYGDTARTPFRVGDPQLLLTARKGPQT